MTENDRLAAAVAQGREDAVQVGGPQEDGVQVCGNCDGRKCMDCVFRTVHDYCTDDCPSCCTPAPVSSPAGEDVDAAARLAHARLMWAHKVNGFGTPWEALTESQRDGWREFVRDVSQAAAPPAGGDVERVPAVDLPPEYDGHTPTDAADRLRALLDGDGEGRES